MSEATFYLIDENFKPVANLPEAELEKLLTSATLENAPELAELLETGVLLAEKVPLAIQQADRLGSTIVTEALKKAHGDIAISDSDSLPPDEDDTPKRKSEF
jgi:hypothetical protein